MKSDKSREIIYKLQSGATIRVLAPELHKGTGSLTGSLVVDRFRGCNVSWVIDEPLPYEASVRGPMFLPIQLAVLLTQGIERSCSK